MIKFKDFGIIPTEYGFDLVRFVEARKLGDGTMKNPTGDIYLKQVEIGYGYTFESVIKRIAHLISIDNLPEEPSLRDYVLQFKKCTDEVSKLIRQ